MRFKLEPNAGVCPLAGPPKRSPYSSRCRRGGYRVRLHLAGVVGSEQVNGRAFGLALREPSVIL